MPQQHITSSALLQVYQALLNERGYTADAAQQAGMARLQVLFDDLEPLHRQPMLRRPLHGLKKWFKIPVSSPKKIQGVWLWGGVGRGKSFMMDCFYDALPSSLDLCKTRIHFHEFMRSIHQELEALKGIANPLDTVAKQVAAKYQLICFDEFHVSDVADAMILHRLLDGLFRHGVVFVMTSNYPPDNLYPDGLHRDRILPAIALLNANLAILNIDTGIDYRRRTLAQVPAFWQPSDALAHSALSQAFATLAECADEAPELWVENRLIHATRKAGSVLWCSFAQLCDTPRSQNDYLEIAAQFSTLILTDVPQLQPSQAASARRFTWLIDVLYDHKIKLLLAAATPPEAIYVQGQYANEFHRTVSRLIEMQSREYLEAERRLTVAL